MTEPTGSIIGGANLTMAVPQRRVEESAVEDGAEVPVRHKIVKVSRNDALAVRIAYHAYLDLGETPPLWMKWVVDALDEPPSANLPSEAVVVGGRSAGSGQGGSTTGRSNAIRTWARAQGFAVGNQQAFEHGRKRRV